MNGIFDTMKKGFQAAMKGSLEKKEAFAGLWSPNILKQGWFMHGSAGDADSTGFFFDTNDVLPSVVVIATRTTRI